MRHFIASQLGSNGGGGEGGGDDAQGGGLFGQPMASLHGETSHWVDIGVYWSLDETPTSKEHLCTAAARLSVHMLRAIDGDTGVDHPWHVQPPFWIPCWPSQELQGASRPHARLHFLTGDALHDEWLVVWAVARLCDHESVGAPLWISVRDPDGQVLLVEAAPWLPSWLQPGCSLHRAWLGPGSERLLEVSSPTSSSSSSSSPPSSRSPAAHLHVLPLPTNPAHLVAYPNLAQPSLEDALRALGDPLLDTVRVGRKATTALWQGRLGAEPSTGRSAGRHLVLLWLPLRVARIVRRVPQAVGRAVEALGSRDPLDVRTLGMGRHSLWRVAPGCRCAACGAASQGPFHARGQAKQAQGEGESEPPVVDADGASDGAQPEPWVPVRVCMSRVAFARLSMESFRPPARRPELCVPSGQAPSERDEPKAYRGWALGATLACAVELWYGRLLEREQRDQMPALPIPQHYDWANDSEWQRVVDTVYDGASGVVLGVAAAKRPLPGSSREKHELGWLQRQYLVSHVWSQALEHAWPTLAAAADAQDLAVASRLGTAWDGRPDGQGVGSTSGGGGGIGGGGSDEDGDSDAGDDLCATMVPANWMVEPLAMEVEAAVRDQSLHVALFTSVLHDGESDDDESWMHVAPSEVDDLLAAAQQEMEQWDARRRARGEQPFDDIFDESEVKEADKRGGSHGSASSHGTAVVEGEEDDGHLAALASLKQMVQGVESFMAHESDLDGIEPAGVGAVPTNASDHTDMGHESGFTMQHLMDQMGAELGRGGGGEGDDAMDAEEALAQSILDTYAEFPGSVGPLHTLLSQLRPGEWQDMMEETNGKADE